jgi:hypothetical protein
VTAVGQSFFFSASRPAFRCSPAAAFGAGADDEDPLVGAGAEDPLDGFAEAEAVAELELDPDPDPEEVPQDAANITKRTGRARIACS